MAGRVLTPHGRAADDPGLTIVIPSYQRRDELCRLLDSIDDAVAGLPLPRVDVVVVLDGSTDGSLEALGRRTSDVGVDVVWQPNGGLAAARNRGLDRAGGGLVWLLDDDMRVGPATLGRHLHHDRVTAPVLMGPCTIVTADPDARHAGAFYADRHERLAAAGARLAADDCSFANTSAPTELLRTYRFDERFRGYGIEDYELATRLLDDGIEIAFDPLATVDHDWRPTPAGRRRKLREEGGNRVRFVELHPDRAAVVFRSRPGRVERALRRVARPATGRLLAAVAFALGTASRAVPVRRLRDRLSTWADQCNVYCGVAAAGGVPPLPAGGLSATP